MIKNNVYYEFFASTTVPNHEQVGYWIDLGANSKGKVIKVYNPDINKWVKLTDVTSEDAVAPFIGSNGNWWVDDRDTGIPAAGKNPYIGDNSNWFVYDPSKKDYVDTGIVAKGLTAYEIAKRHGFVGTEEEWLASLMKPAEDAAIVALQAADKANASVVKVDVALNEIGDAKEQAIAAADRANELSDNPMKIIGGYWWVYNETTKEYENTGISATGKGFTISKSYPSIAAMEADHDNPDVGIGEFVIISTGDTEDPDEAKLYNKLVDGWQYLTDLSGSQGVQGMSAYQVAVKNGYIGTEAEWVVSLSKDSKDAAKEALAAKDQVLTTETNIKAEEAKRVTAEQARVTAESGRASAESTRVSNETKRVTAETNRATAETSRSGAETIREAHEAARVKNEDTRVSNEEVRKTSEIARDTAEGLRATAETSRQGFEDDRQTAENTRDASETLRVNAETARKTAETSRGEAEDTRELNETARQSNETVRETQEAKRQTDTANAISAVNTAKTAAETATTNANTAANNANAKAELATEAALHQPIIKNGTWWVYKLMDVPVEKEKEVYAITEDGSFYKYDDLSNVTEDNIIGIFIKDNTLSTETSFVLDPLLLKTVFLQSLPFVSNILPANCGTDEYDGYNNTEALLKYYGDSEGFVLGKTNSLISTIGTKCYILSYKEASAFIGASVDRAFPKINNILNHLNIPTLSTVNVIATSTEVGNKDIRYVSLGSYSDQGSKQNKYRVFPTSKLPHKIYMDTGIPATGDAGKSPIIQDGTWWLYNNVTGEYENTNVSVSSDYELTKAKIENVLTGDIATHTHDNRYYTEAEVDEKIANSASKSLVIDVDGSMILPGVFQQVREALDNNTEILIRLDGILRKPVTIEDGGVTVAFEFAPDITEKTDTTFGKLSRDRLMMTEADECFRNKAFVETLTKDNNIVYTPTTDYNPATKKYVDDSIANVAVEPFVLTLPYTEEGVDTPLPSGTYAAVLNAFLSKKEFLINFGEEQYYYKPTIVTADTDSSIITFEWNTSFFTPENFKESRQYQITIIINDSFRMYISVLEVLSIDNTAAYTPSEDYNPATKKYVDDEAVKKVDKIDGKQLSTEDYTTAEKTKLSKIGGYVSDVKRVEQTPDSITVQVLKQYPDESSSDTSILYFKEATTTTAGVMTAADKNKLDTGVATLDETGKVPASQLPAYVDDVLEFANKEAFPATGETGKIYVALDTNLTWRWSGTTYVEISPSIALGETSSTAYPGDKGKANADAIAGMGNVIITYDVRSNKFVNRMADPMITYLNDKITIGGWKFPVDIKSNSKEFYYTWGFTGSSDQGIKSKVWHSGNQGVDSGLDADLLDGKQGSEYLLAQDANGKFLSLTGGTITGDMSIQSSSTASYLYFKTDGDSTSEKAAIYYAQGSGLFIDNWNAPGGTSLTLEDNGKLTYNTGEGANNIVWHAGNDGINSGLDADLLDGKQGSEYALKTEIPTTLPASDVSAWAKAATKPTYTKAEVGLNNVDNTSDLNKPISTAVKTELDKKLIDAPVDSKTYGRKNGIWSEISSPYIDLSYLLTESTVTDAQLAELRNAAANKISTVVMGEAYDTASIYEDPTDIMINVSNARPDYDGSQILSALMYTVNIADKTISREQSMNQLTTAGDGTKYLSDNGQYNTIPKATVELPFGLLELIANFKDTATSDQIKAVFGTDENFINICKDIYNGAIPLIKNIQTEGTMSSVTSLSDVSQCSALVEEEMEPTVLTTMFFVLIYVPMFQMEFNIGCALRKSTANGEVIYSAEGSTYKGITRQAIHTSIGTPDPSAGADGDIWIQYTE